MRKRVDYKRMKKAYKMEESKNNKRVFMSEWGRY